jgi:hypothetical protein
MALSCACRHRLGLTVAGTWSLFRKSYCLVSNAGLPPGPGTIPSGSVAMKPRFASSKSARSLNGSVLRKASLTARLAGSASFDCANDGEKGVADSKAAANRLAIRNDGMKHSPTAAWSSTCATRWFQPIRTNA